MRRRIGEFAYSENRRDLGYVEEREETTLEDGSKYKGCWLRGMETRQGQGVMTWPDGSVYEGYWKDNKPDGKGRMVSSKGDIYDGQWLNGMASGQGKFTHRDGTVYEGFWKED